MKIIFFILLFFIYQSLPLGVFSQNISGEWYGWGNLNGLPDENNFMLSLKLAQNGEEIEGVMSIYYMNEYRVFSVFGVFDKKNKNLLISNIAIPIHFYNLPNFGKLDIDMYLDSKLINARQINQIRGNLISRSYKNLKNINFVLVKPYTIENVDIPIDKDQPIYTNFNTKERKVLITQDIQVYSDTIKLSLYDGSIVDGDTVTIFYNNKILVERLRLSEKETVINLALDKKTTSHTIVFMAENLGSIPPNTGVMIVYDGDRRHEVFFSNSLNISSGVILTR